MGAGVGRVGVDDCGSSGLAIELTLRSADPVDTVVATVDRLRTLPLLNRVYVLLAATDDVELYDCRQLDELSAVAPYGPRDRTLGEYRSDRLSAEGGAAFHRSDTVLRRELTDGDALRGGSCVRPRGHDWFSFDAECRGVLSAGERPMTRLLTLAAVAAMLDARGVCSTPNSSGSFSGVVGRSVGMSFARKTFHLDGFLTGTARG